MAWGPGPGWPRGRPGAADSPDAAGPTLSRPPGKGLHDTVTEPCGTRTCLQPGGLSAGFRAGPAVTVTVTVRTLPPGQSPRLPGRRRGRGGGRVLDSSDCPSHSPHLFCCHQQPSLERCLPSRKKKHQERRQKTRRLTSARGPAFPCATPKKTVRSNFCPLGRVAAGARRGSGRASAHGALGAPVNLCGVFRGRPCVAGGRL